MKKLLTISLVVCLVVGLSFTVFAEAESDDVDTSFQVQVTNPTVLWNSGNLGTNFNVSSVDGFKDHYQHGHTFIVRSTTSYNINVEVTTTGDSWGNVVMDKENNGKVSGSTSYADAFDVRVSKQDGTWGDWTTGPSGILFSESNTLPTGSEDNQRKINYNDYIHSIQLRFVLVDDDVRRFVELPEGNYNTDLKLTVTESF